MCVCCQLLFLVLNLSLSFYIFLYLSFRFKRKKKLFLCAVLCCNAGWMRRSSAEKLFYYFSTDLFTSFLYWKCFCEFKTLKNTHEKWKLAIKVFDVCGKNIFNYFSVKVELLVIDINPNIKVSSFKCMASNIYTQNIYIKLSFLLTKIH